jgi:DNA-directed RNA polymerase specialized sigma subunit
MEKLNAILDVLLKIYEIMQLISTKTYGNLTLPEDEMLTRLEVMKYLGISDSTYKRKVRKGILKPSKLPGGDRFYKSELKEEFLESKRRGRI